MTNNDFMSKLKESYGCDDIKPAMVNGEESNTIFVMTKENKQWYVKVDLDRKELIAETMAYLTVGEFENDVAIVSDGTLSALYDVDFRIMSSCYEEITRLSNGLFMVKGMFGYGIINSEGTEVVACIFDKITYDEDIKKYEIFEIA